MNGPPPTPSAEMLDTIVRVHQAYASLMNYASLSDDPILGGQLLYVGELDNQGRTFAIAANIAGAATLAASQNPAALRHAQREGAIDFLVNSLDEALRILKNEIRNREAVAVAVSLSPAEIEAEMMNRGVLPNLLPPKSAAAGPPSAIATFVAQGAQLIPAPRQTALLVWAAPAEYAQNLAAFESIIAGHLAPSDYLNRRWLRLSPRYLGPYARRLRSVACDEITAAKLFANLGAPLNK